MRHGTLTRELINPPCNPEELEPRLAGSITCNQKYAKHPGNLRRRRVANRETQSAESDNELSRHSAERVESISRLDKLGTCLNANYTTDCRPH